MSDSPAAILYNEAGTDAVSVVDDAGTKRLAVDSGQGGAGNPTIVTVKGGASSNLASVNNANRLLVDAQISSAGAGAINEFLLNGTSPEMAVDGETTPVVFEWTPGATYDVETTGLSLVVEDGSLKFGEYFMGEDTLPNGVLIEIKSNDVVYQIANLKRTREILQETAPGGFDLFVASPNVVRGYFGIGGLILKKAGTFTTDDYVRLTVRDDLSKLDHMSAFLQAKEIQI